jgi:hypothetical protein
MRIAVGIAQSAPSEVVERVLDHNLEEKGT